MVVTTFLRVKIKIKIRERDFTALQDDVEVEICDSANLFLLSSKEIEIARECIFTYCIASNAVMRRWELLQMLPVVHSKIFNW